MKKILCALLALILVFCFCACDDNDGEANNTAGNSVNQNTVSVVNKAYDNTEEVVLSAEKLGFEVNFSRNLTYGDQSDVMGLGFKYNFVGKGEGRQFLYETNVKQGSIDEQVMMYSDGKKVYGYKADTTYLIVNDVNTSEFIDSFAEDITVVNASDFKVIDTVIMDTSSGGLAFVLTYDVNSADFNPEDVFGPLYAEGLTDYEIKPTLLKVSGIINTDGKITEQTVSYQYTYEYEDMSGVDPDNSDVKGVMKTAKVKLEAAIKFNYSISSITAPSKITIVEDTEGGEGETVEVKEISLTDFLKIGQQSTQDK